MSDYPIVLWLRVQQWFNCCLKCGSRGPAPWRKAGRASVRELRETRIDLRLTLKQMYGRGPLPESTNSWCWKCPPTPCDECGGTNGFDVMCDCWESLEGKSLADLKAIFAEMDLSLGQPRIGAGER